MNFIYIHTHDSGRIMQPYGYACETPALMKLAHEGILFRQAYCTAPTCSPSRAGMLMGMAPHNTGMLGLAHFGHELNDYSKHLGCYLKNHGYHTALIGVQHESGRSDHERIGYSEYCWNRLPTNHDTDYAHTEVATQFLAGAKQLGKPFFLSFGLRCTHREYPELTPEELAEAEYCIPPFPIPDTPENRIDFCRYQKSVRIADECIGRLLRAVDEYGLREDTVIMYTTDHGVAMPQMKCNLYDTGTGVALILRHPAFGHACSDALISHVDVYPTVCDILGAPKPEWLQGRSFLPLMQALNTRSPEEKASVDHFNDYVFSEVTFHASFEPMRSVRSERCKLIRYYFPGAEYHRTANVDASAPKDVYFSTKLSRLPRPKEEFFDLMADPCERINLVGNEAYAEEYAELSAALDEWMVRTDDPLLRSTDMAELGKGKQTVPYDCYQPGAKYMVNIE